MRRGCEQSRKRRKLTTFWPPLLPLLTYIINTDGILLLTSPVAGSVLTTPPTCYACVNSGSGTSCSDVGILPSVLAVVAGLMIERAFAIWGGKEPEGGVTVYEGGSMRNFKVPRRPNCRICGGTAAKQETPACPSAPNPRVKAVNISEALALCSRGWRLVDVRTESERAVSMLKGAIADVPESGKAVFVCRTGIRAGNACEKFVEGGGEGAVLEGGMGALKGIYPDMPLI